MRFSNFAAHALVTTALAMTAIHGVAKENSNKKHTATLGLVEYITSSEELVPGGTTYFIESAIKKFMSLQRDTGNGQFAHDFVYGDPRNAQFDGGNPDITFAVADNNTSSDINLQNQERWFRDSLWVWADQTCSIPFLSEITDNDEDFPGIVNIFFGGGGIPPIWEADVTQVGFFSYEDYSQLSAFNPFVLGVAYTFFWVDSNGDLTDIDNNGKADVAFREIYYNDGFEWSDNGADDTYDFPTVAIHEAGHGLSAAHFGSIGLQGGALVARPRTIMNAIYGGPLRQLTGRDEATHCSNWSQWPLH